MTLLTVVVDDEAGTARLAELLAMILASGDVVALEGDLGAGKSAFARAVLRVLADDPHLEVPSPTFTLVQTYELAGLAVAHFDLYRLGDAGELDEIGFDHAIRTGVALVEWPDRASGALPAATLTVRIGEVGGPTGRIFELSGDPAVWGRRLDRSRRIRALVDGLGGPPAIRRRMAGDASARRFERVARPGAPPLVAMDWPRRPPQPPLRDGLAYPELVHVQDDPLAFAGMAAMLAGAGFAAPVLRAGDRAEGLLLVDDLGADGLVEDGRPVAGRFLAAAGVLAEKDATQFPPSAAVPGWGAWAPPAFDRRAMEVELSLLPDWYLPLAGGDAGDPGAADGFVEAWSPVLDRIGTLPRGLVLRDAISANLVWRGDRDGRARIGFVDIQDAMTGPEAYDIMSLVTDVRLDLPDDLVAAMLAGYRETRRRADAGFDPDGLPQAIALLSAQRNSKILGGFARLAVRDGKRGYLAHIPRVRRRVAAALAHPVLRPLRLWYERHRLLD